MLIIILAVYFIFFLLLIRNFQYNEVYVGGRKIPLENIIDDFIIVRS